MKGEIISYMSSKKYGFVRGEDGESYFLHISSLGNPELEPQLVPGVQVDFTPTPTPKGIAAKEVSICRSYFVKSLSDFITTKHKTPKSGAIEVGHSVTTRFFKDPNQGREHLRQIADKMGCNAILNLRSEKEMFAKGSQRITMYAFKADISIVTELSPCSEQSQQDASFAEVDTKVKQASSLVASINDTEQTERNKQLRDNSWMYKVAAIASIALLGLALLID
ncbi:cold shock domain-containing protein [Shewanella sp. WXL01]|uniref:Cold shock domain-containing protein n=1 Tax=Shewanella maritima TaxID=2520507 RepID=A0A411PJY0_9GAMM|nr:cold shock domain-containing protein [Shewanella maritima]NKF50888.1 cold shock domain-containing protein [Shewanella sp. WXL01]QBF83859.1 cold shock domain-containing protein [Shewanella maritima]